MGGWKLHWTGCFVNNLSFSLIYKTHYDMSFSCELCSNHEFSGTRLQYVIAIRLFHTVDCDLASYSAHVDGPSKTW